MKKIISRNNKIIKEVKSLNTKKNRDEENLFIIEGNKVIIEALKKGVLPKYILCCENQIETFLKSKSISGIDIKKEKNTDNINDKIYITDNEIINDISDTNNPSGILAVFIKEKPSIKKAILSNELLLILDRISDPGNLGTIIRSADAFGCKSIIMSAGCVDLYNPKVIRSSMGSILNLNICQDINLKKIIHKIKGLNKKVLAAHLDVEVNIKDNINFNNTAIIIGNEANGIEMEIANMADKLLKIPITSNTESLNVAIAVGIILYESKRNI